MLAGGERKRNEILQLKLLNPKFAFLDEIDSGLDVDAINVVANAINEEKEKGMSFLVISHYARLFNLIKPKRAVVMVNGTIVLEGGFEIIEKIDNFGYEWISKELGITIKKEEVLQPISLGVCGVKDSVK